MTLDTQTRFINLAERRARDNSEKAQLARHAPHLTSAQLDTYIAIRRAVGISILSIINAIQVYDALNTPDHKHAKRILECVRTWNRTRPDEAIALHSIIKPPPEPEPLPQIHEVKYVDGKLKAVRVKPEPIPLLVTFTPEAKPAHEVDLYHAYRSRLSLYSSLVKAPGRNQPPPRIQRWATTRGDVTIIWHNTDTHWHYTSTFSATVKRPDGSALRYFVHTRRDGSLETAWKPMPPFVEPEIDESACPACSGEGGSHDDFYREFYMCYQCGGTGQKKEK